MKSLGLPESFRDLGPLIPAKAVYPVPRVAGLPCGQGLGLEPAPRPLRTQRPLEDVRSAPWPDPRCTPLSLSPRGLVPRPHPLPPKCSRPPDTPETRSREGRQRCVVRRQRLTSPQIRPPRLAGWRPRTRQRFCPRPNAGKDSGVPPRGLCGRPGLGSGRGPPRAEGRRLRCAHQCERRSRVQTPTHPARGLPSGPAPSGQSRWRTRFTVPRM